MELRRGLIDEGCFLRGMLNDNTYLSGVFEVNKGLKKFIENEEENNSEDE